jgi:two-component system, response regulator RegA
MPGPVLVIDDDRDVLHAARLALAAAVSGVETAQTPDGLERRLEDVGFEAVLLDMNFAIGDHSGREGLGLIGRIGAVDSSLSIVLMTTFGGVALAVEALKSGVADFVLKPWRNDRLAEAVTAACQKTRLARMAASSFDLDRAEKAEIQRALDYHGRNISRAAAALGMTRQALYRRMARHGL